MNRVIGIGGIFFKARDPAALRSWYQQHLGINILEWGGTIFYSTDAAGSPCATTTHWSISSESSEYFAPSKSSFMINYRVADVRALLKVLAEEGCNVIDKCEESEFGKFGWVIDPEGNKVELWEAPPGM